MKKKKILATFFFEVLMTSNQENFDENMTKFLDYTAESLGDVIGAACSDPVSVLTRFCEVMVGAAKNRLENSN